MTAHRIMNDYFEWLFNIVCDDGYSEVMSYRTLLMFMHDTDFRYSIPRDQNRAEDGISLRYRFALEYGLHDVPTCLDGPCSLLEMMVALSLHCEEIMDDPSIGDRTRQWFWGMIVNLGLGAMSDARFDKRTANDIIEDFLDRNYEPNGKGGLFTVRHCDVDLRNVEIWCQMCWYLNNIT